LGALDDPEPDVREQAAWALGMIRDERAIDTLRAALKDEDPDVREQVAWALGMLLTH
jgi:HEAT repeat protein